MNTEDIRDRFGLSRQCCTAALNITPMQLGHFNVSVPHYRFSPIQCDPPDWLSQPRPEIAVAFHLHRPLKRTDMEREFMRLSLQTTPHSWEKRLAVLGELSEVILNEGPGWYAITYPWIPDPQTKQVEQIPLALIDAEMELRWLNPAAKAHHLVNAEFPSRQRHRSLGDEIPWERYEDAYAISAEDEATGVPVWFQAARSELATCDIPPDERTHALIHFHAVRLARRHKSRARKVFMEKAVEEYISTFTRYFARAPQGFAQSMLS